MVTEISAEFLLVVDLEATCDQERLPHSERETIEIGAVLVDADTLSVVREFQAFVKPVRHEELTPYCIELTGIQQSDVQGADGFVDVFGRFIDQMFRDHDVCFVSWGGFDLRQLSRDAGFHSITNPIESGVDMSLSFTKAAGLTRRPSMGKAMEMVGLSVEGTLHRGIDDARNLTRLLPWCLGRKSIDLA